MAGGSKRFPPLGPRTPNASVTLAVVLQDLQLQIWYLRRDTSKFKVLSCSLIHADDSSEDDGKIVSQDLNPGSMRICTTAAIGLGYNGAYRRHRIHVNPL
jgi:hypothetical protein